MLNQHYHNQQHYEAFTEEKNAPLEIRDAQMSSEWQEFIPIKYNYLEFDQKLRYKPGYEEYGFKGVQPYYRTEITYMPIPRKQNHKTHQDQIKSNQIQYDYQSNRYDIEMPANFQQTMSFGQKKREYTTEVDEKRRANLKSEMMKIQELQEQEHLKFEQQNKQAQKKEFIMTSQQYEESERYAKEKFSMKKQKCNCQQQQELQYHQGRSQHFHQQKGQQLHEQNQQARYQIHQQIPVPVHQVQQVVNYPPEQPQGMTLNPLQYSQRINQQHLEYYQQEQNQGMVLNPIKFQQNLNQEQNFHLQQQQEQSQGMVLNPLKYSQRNQQCAEIQQEEMVGVNGYPVQIQEVVHHQCPEHLTSSGFTFNPPIHMSNYRTTQTFLPSQSALDQYLYENDLAKRRIEDTRMLNRVRSEEHLFYRSHSPRYRFPFHEAQGLESNSFYAKPNLFKHSLPIIH